MMQLNHIYDYMMTPVDLNCTGLHIEENWMKLNGYQVGKQQVDSLCQDEYGATSHVCVGGDIAWCSLLSGEWMDNYIPLEDVVCDRTEDGSTPIHYAALHGHLQVVKLFISELNCNTNTPGSHGRIPLHYTAAQGGLLDIIK